MRSNTSWHCLGSGGSTSTSHTEHLEKLGGGGDATTFIQQFIYIKPIFLRIWLLRQKNLCVLKTLRVNWKRHSDDAYLGWKLRKRGLESTGYQRLRMEWNKPRRSQLAWNWDMTLTQVCLPNGGVKRLARLMNTLMTWQCIWGPICTWSYVQFPVGRGTRDQCSTHLKRHPAPHQNIWFQAIWHPHRCTKKQNTNAHKN